MDSRLRMETFEDKLDGKDAILASVLFLLRIQMPGRNPLSLLLSFAKVMKPVHGTVVMGRGGFSLPKQGD